MATPSNAGPLASAGTAVATPSPAHGNSLQQRVSSLEQEVASHEQMTDQLRRVLEDKEKLNNELREQLAQLQEQGGRSGADRFGETGPNDGAIGGGAMDVDGVFDDGDDDDGLLLPPGDDDHVDDDNNELVLNQPNAAAQAVPVAAADPVPPAQAPPVAAADPVPADQVLGQPMAVDNDAPAAEPVPAVPAAAEPVPDVQANPAAPVLNPAAQEFRPIDHLPPGTQEFDAAAAAHFLFSLHCLDTRRY